MRRALSELEAMGMVVHQPNRGAAVRDFTATEVEQIYSVRELLERQAALLMPLPADPQVVAELEAIQSRHTAAVASYGRAYGVFARISRSIACCFRRAAIRISLR